MHEILIFLRPIEAYVKMKEVNLGFSGKGEMADA